MASAAIFSSLRRRRLPTLQAFLAPVNLSDVQLLQALASLSSEIVSSFSARSLPFQVKNSRSLIRKIQVFVHVLEYIRDSTSNLPSTSILCFKELHLLLYRSKTLLDYCSQSSKLWLLLQNHAISGHFHDLNQEMSTILDIFPLNELSLSEDMREHVQLLQNQSRRAKLFIDKHDDSLRLNVFSFLDELENGRIPNPVELRLLFVENLGINDVNSFRAEIEYLEEQIINQECGLEPTVPVLNGLVALARYSRFLLFGFEENEVELSLLTQKNLNRSSEVTADTSVQIPKDFCCPISLDLMRDPVIIWSGQTYDRSSISRWMQEGHSTCPKTGQNLAHNKLVPNRALRNLIMHWCHSHNIPYDTTPSSDSFSAASASKAAVEANKATVGLLIEQLANGSPNSQAISALEVRLLAKTAKENRAYIAEAGAIPLLKDLLSSPNVVAQENSVTALLNLSIYEKNKSRIIEENGCLISIVEVLRFGHSIEARENAAATLFSLSAVHDYKKRIAGANGAIEALARLLMEGTERGRKDAVTALFNLSTHIDNCARMIESGAVTALVEALGSEVVAEEASGALALIVRQPAGAEAVVKEEAAVAGLIQMMRCGTAKGKENAVAALLELCRCGGTAATQRVVRVPALAGLIQGLLFSGTKRARRKAASLYKVFQRCENSNSSLHFGGIGLQYAFAGNLNPSGETDFSGDVSVQMSISVPVL